MARWPQVVSPTPDSKERTIQPARLFRLQKHRGICITLVSCVFCVQGKGRRRVTRSRNFSI